MTRVLVLLVALIPAVTIALAQEQSQGSNSKLPNSFEIEPSVLKQNLSPEHPATDTSTDAVARLEKKLEDARRDAQGVERLFKTGVISKVEMEQRVLQMIQCESDLANARLAEAKQKVADLQSAAASDESAKHQLASAKVALKQLGEAAEAATAKRNRAEVEAAEANLRRQQQLLKRGIAEKSDVDRAEEELASLRRSRINEQ